jgi:hypothetical protein
MSLDITAVIARLNALVPQDWTIGYTPEGDAVSVTYKHALGSTAGPVQGEGSSAHPTDMATSLLSFVQDEITMETRRPWPEHRGNLAMPQARQQGDCLHVWYGSADEVTLDLGEFPV